MQDCTIIPNLRVRACVKCIVWVCKTERKTKYIVSKVTKFQLEKYLIVKEFLSTTQEDENILPQTLKISNGDFPELR